MTKQVLTGEDLKEMAQLLKQIGDHNHVAMCAIVRVAETVSPFERGEHETALENITNSTDCAGKVMAILHRAVMGT